MASEFERVAADCLDRLASGKGSVEDSLQRFPQFASELRPILNAAIKLQTLEAIQPTRESRHRIRGELLVHMRTHPRRATLRSFSLRPKWGLATSLAVLVLAAFSTTTAFAQYTLPGDTLYGWKRTSENLWRAISPDPLQTDITLAQRRLNEYMDPHLTDAQRDELLQSYTDTLDNIASEFQNMPEFSQATLSELVDQQVQLNANGVQVGELDNLLELWSSVSGSPTAEPYTESPLASATSTFELLDSQEPDEKSTPVPTKTETISNQGQGNQGQGQGNNGQGNNGQGNNGQGKGNQGGGNKGKGKDNQGGKKPDNPNKP